jgi:hypothetical protein
MHEEPPQPFVRDYENRHWRMEENARVAAWRIEQLLAVGYELADAEKLAATDVDLHDAIALVTRRGCQPDAAARILL